MNMEAWSCASGSTTSITCLFPEILTLIFRYLDVRDKGRVAQVCTAWHEAAYNKLVWRGVQAKLHLRRTNHVLLASLARRGIKRVQILSFRRGLRDVIVELPRLEALSFSGCFGLTDISLSHAVVTDVPSLSVLDLSLCKQITDRGVAVIASHLHNLETLNLAGCSGVTSNGLQLIATRLRKLHCLILRGCRHISDRGIGFVSGVADPAILQDSPPSSTTVSTDADQKRLRPYGLSELHTLILQDCQALSDEALRFISLGLGGCLRTLDLSFCASVTDSGVKWLARMPSLRELNLRSCDNVSDIGMGYLAENGSRLTSLDVSFCERVTDAALVHISQGLLHIRALSVNACGVGDDGLARLARSARDLTTLNLGQCSRLTDTSLHAVAQHLRHLESIDLYGCTRITTAGLERIMQLPKLKTLNLGLWRKA